MALASVVCSFGESIQKPVPCPTLPKKKKKSRGVSQIFHDASRSTPARTDGREIIALSVECDLRDLTRSLRELDSSQEIGGAAGLRRGESPLDGAGRGGQRSGGRLSCVE